MYYLTLIRSLSAFISIYYSFKNEFTYSCVLLVLAVWLDFFVNFFKRKLSFNKNFHLHLEGFVDFTCFGIAPAFFLLMLEAEGVILMSLVIFTVACMFRIARFNQEGLINGHYRGLPVTYNGYIIPAVYVLTCIPDVLPYRRIIFSAVLNLVSIAMVSSKIKIKEIG